MGEQSPEELMRAYLMGENPILRRSRMLFRHLPSSPHCKLCAAPFAGLGGAILRHVGFGRFAGNPAICRSCISGLQDAGVAGAEIPVSLLFADIRGSTAIAERMRPGQFRAFLDGFYRLSSSVILRHDGIVDKFVGDEVIGLFFTGVAGERFTAAAIAAARELLELAARKDTTDLGPIPLGAAIHSGIAFVGSSSSGGAVNDFTALGDVVNTTARMAGEAASGELLISAEAATAGGIESQHHERRTIPLRGRSEPIEVVSVRVPGAGH